MRHDVLVRGFRHIFLIVMIFIFLRLKRHPTVLHPTLTPTRESATMKVREENQLQKEGAVEDSAPVGVKRTFSTHAEGDDAVNQSSTTASTPGLGAIAAAAAAAAAAPFGVDLSIHSGTNGVGQGSGGGGNGGGGGDGGNHKKVKVGDAVAVVPGDAFAPGAGVAAVPNCAMEPAEPLPNRLKPQDPSLRIHEVTNDGGAANMEMLIHLKASLNHMYAPCEKERALHLIFK